MKQQALDVFAQLLANNTGNRITNELIHGLLVVANQQIQNDRVDPPDEVAEPTETVP